MEIETGIKSNQCPKCGASMTNQEKHPGFVIMLQEYRCENENCKHTIPLKYL